MADLIIRVRVPDDVDPADNDPHEVADDLIEAARQTYDRDPEPTYGPDSKFVRISAEWWTP